MQISYLYKHQYAQSAHAYACFGVRDHYFIRIDTLVNVIMKPNVSAADSQPSSVSMVQKNLKEVANIN